MLQVKHKGLARITAGDVKQVLVLPVLVQPAVAPADSHLCQLKQQGQQQSRQHMLQHTSAPRGQSPKAASRKGQLGTSKPDCLEPCLCADARVWLCAAGSKTHSCTCGQVRRRSMPHRALDVDSRLHNSNKTSSSNQPCE